MTLTRALVHTAFRPQNATLKHIPLRPSFSSRFHSSACRAKASIVFWGYGSTEMDVFKDEIFVAQGLYRTQIAAGASHCLVAASGEGGSGFLGRGMNHSGQLGSGTRDNEITYSSVVTTGLDISAVACGREHSMLLARPHNNVRPSPSSQRTVLLGFGNSMYGQLGLGGSKETLGKEFAGEQVNGFVFEPSPTSVQLPDPEENVVQVVCGLDHTVLRTDKGNLYSMGWGADGQLGLGPESSSDRSSPTLIDRLSWKTKGKELGRVKEISSSTDFTLALLENNEIWIWGNAEYGQCMVNKKIDRILEPMHIPHPISKSETIAAVAAGGTFGLLLTQSGNVYTCGYGALGLGPEKTQILMPEQITALSGIRKIVASTDYAAAIDGKGDLYTWGTCGKTGRLGHGDFENRFVPMRVAMPLEQGGRKVIVHDVALGHDGALAMVE